MSSEGPRGCKSPWAHKESDTTELRMQACRLTLNKAQCPGLLPFTGLWASFAWGWGGSVLARAEGLRNNTLFAICV